MFHHKVKYSALFQMFVFLPRRRQNYPKKKQLQKTTYLSACLQPPLENLKLILCLTKWLQGIHSGVVIHILEAAVPCSLCDIAKWVVLICFCFCIFHTFDKKKNVTVPLVMEQWANIQNTLSEKRSEQKM